MRSKNRFPKIQIRLLLALGLFAIIIGTNSLIYIFDVSGMNHLTQGVIDHPFTVSNAVRDIEININVIYRTMKDVVLAKNEIQLNKAVSEVKEYEKLVYLKFEIVEERFLGDLNTIYDAKQTFEKSEPIRNEVIALVKEDRLNEAISLMDSKGATHVKLLFEKIHEMIDFANNKTKEFNDNSIKIMHNARTKFIFILLSTLVFGVVIFLWLFNGISKPLTQLINRVMVVTKKYSINKLPMQTSNQLVILDFAISELENRDEILEKEINSRTHELKVAKNLLKNAIDNAPIGMTMIRLDGLILDANQAFSQFIGYSKAELLKMKFNDFTPDQDKKKGLEFIKRIVNGVSKDEVIEKNYIHKSGEIIQGSVTASLVKDSFDKTIYIFAQIKDISIRKKVELELFEHKAGLESIVKNRTKELDDKTNKLIRSQNALTYLLEDVNESQEKMKILNKQVVETNKELEAFSYSVSHDLKAPLRAVTGFSQILEEDYGSVLDGNAKRYVGLIKENAENMGVLINDLLSFSRLGRKAVKKSPVDIKIISEKIIVGIEAETQNPKAKFKIHPMPLLNADESLMYNVMVNLISNAAKFSGKVENASVEIGCNSENNENVYYVKDNGVGFDMKYANKIFDVFQRLHNSKEFVGTGIGLSIVQRIIYKHGGRVWVQSEINKGTTFFFVI